MSSDKKSHFSKPISEITMEDILVMSEEDLREYIMEHPDRIKKGIHEIDRELVDYLEYKNVLYWAEDLFKYGDNDNYTRINRKPS